MHPAPYSSRRRRVLQIDQSVTRQFPSGYTSTVDAVVRLRALPGGARSARRGHSHYRDKRVAAGDPAADRPDRHAKGSSGKVDSLAADRHRQVAPPGARVPVDGCVEIVVRGAEERGQSGFEINVYALEQLGESGGDDIGGVDPRGDPVARAVARGAGGGLAAVLQRARREGHVQDIGAAARDAGAGSADAQRGVVQSGVRKRLERCPGMVQPIQGNIGIFFWRMRILVCLKVATVGLTILRKAQKITIDLIPTSCQVPGFSRKCLTFRQIYTSLAFVRIIGLLRRGNIKNPCLASLFIGLATLSTWPIYFSGIGVRPRPEPSLGPVLPRVPSHQPAAAAADVAGAAVREPAAAELPRPGARGARLLRARPGPHPHRAHTEQSTGKYPLPSLLGI